jgi:hypothetical protein
MGTAAVSSAMPVKLPFETLDYDACRKIQRSMVAARKDVVLRGQALEAVASLSQKLRRTRDIVGYGNFNLLSFDEMYRIGRQYSKVGTFTKEETDLFESIFYENAATYGFYGEKVLTSVTAEIDTKETVKVPYTGHYLYRGRPLEMYEKIKADIGDTVVLTSGVRSVVKQMDLFLQKVVRSRGNISVASRSLAPAGYSFHGIGDFDVGKVGMGRRNFTSAFAHTDEFKKLIDSGYIQIRYPKDNPFGVRYEPWHIKVV